MLKVGVKFCGHCNPHRPMGEVYRALLERADEVGVALVPLSEQQQADVVLVLNGCARACAEVPEGRAMEAADAAYREPGALRTTPGRVSNGGQGPTRRGVPEGRAMEAADAAYREPGALRTAPGRVSNGGQGPTRRGVPEGRARRAEAGLAQPNCRARCPGNTDRRKVETGNSGMTPEPKEPREGKVLVVTPWSVDGQAAEPECLPEVILERLGCEARALAFRPKGG